ncbi:MAG: glycerol-3-phosphate 1-O-acyltransferase PlsY [Clostridia bacterium]|nr:glycerol-3-phosphate 1-O-acyltransferase PlsY [Clostridia bacterium]
MSVVKWILCAVIGYLLGCISSGILITKAFSHVDIRSRGSGNAGATNVYRVLGALPSLLTLLCDMLKGVLACLIGSWLCGRNGMLLAGLCTILGHNFPVFFRFKGGKGIATTIGCMLMIQPIFGLVGLIGGLIAIFFVRIVSIVSLCGAFLYIVLTPVFHWGDWLLCGYAAIVGILAIWQHRSNIKRLADGTEQKNKLDFSSKK